MQDAGSAGRRSLGGAGGAGGGAQAAQHRSHVGGAAPHRSFVGSISSALLERFGRRHHAAEPEPVAAEEAPAAAQQSPSPKGAVASPWGSTSDAGGRKDSPMRALFRHHNKEGSTPPGEHDSERGSVKSGYATLGQVCPKDSPCAGASRFVLLAALLGATLLAGALGAAGWLQWGSGALGGPWAASGDWEEWQVAFEPMVNVRRAMSETADVTRQMHAGEVFVGRQQGSWIALADYRGFVALNFRGARLLKRRRNSYLQIVNGDCEDADLHAITQMDVCQHAGKSLHLLALGTPRERIGVHDGDCILMAQPERPICSEQPYPPGPATTTSTTSTTSSSTTATSTSSTTTTQVLLFCFSMMVAKTPEEELVKLQLSARVSIWRCHDAAVFSAERRWLGTNPWDEKGEDIFTWENPAPATEKGDLSHKGVTTSSWLNTAIFIQAYTLLFTDSKQRIWSHDFLVKVDPDTVFYADRLAEHVRSHQGQTVFFTNCRNENGPAMYGAIEVFSIQAIGAYKDNEAKCKTQLPWHGWGEDMYMEMCLRTSKVKAVTDLQLVGDERCVPADCSDTTRAAFHAYKDSESWFRCHEAAGLEQ